MITIKIRPFLRVEPTGLWHQLLQLPWLFKVWTQNCRRSIFQFLSLNSSPPFTHNVNLNTFRATFESLKALIRSSLIAFAMITRIESLRHSATTSTKLRSHIEPLSSVCLCTECIQALASVRISMIPTSAGAQLKLLDCSPSAVCFPRRSARSQDRTCSASVSS